jgi:hypothetical protein
LDKITITIRTGNSAFDGNVEGEVSRILRELASKIESGREPSKVMDINGNSVGTVEYEY